MNNSCICQYSKIPKTEIRDGALFIYIKFPIIYHMINQQYQIVVLYQVLLFIFIAMK